MRALVLASGLLIAASAYAYVVQPGDTLSKIAAKELGAANRWREIASANGITDPSKIRIGVELIIPSNGAPKAEAPSPSKPTKKTKKPATLNPSGPASAITTPRPPLPAIAREELFPQELRVISSVGRVVFDRAGTSRDAVVGEKMRPGEHIYLSPEARVILSGSGGERIILENGAYASLELRSLSSEERSFRFRMDRGLLRLTIPSTPMTSRYEVALPIGILRIVEGQFEAEVLDPAHVSLTVGEGSLTAELPLGNIEVSAGNSVVLDTLRKPAPAVPSPKPPALSLQTTPGIAVAAAAGRFGDTISYEVFTDEDRLDRHAALMAPGDAFGVGVARFRLPTGRYWISAQSITPDGRRSPAVVEGPIEILGTN